MRSVIYCLLLYGGRIENMLDGSPKAGWLDWDSVHSERLQISLVVFLDESNRRKVAAIVAAALVAS